MDINFLDDKEEKINNKNKNSEIDLNKKSSNNSNNKHQKSHKHKKKAKEPFYSEKEKDNKYQIGVNLVTDEMKEVIPTKRKRLVSRFVTILVLVCICFVSFGVSLNYYDQKKNTELEKITLELSTIKEQISKYDEDKLEVITVFDRINMVDKFLDYHIYWTNILKLIEEKTLQEVHYSNLSVDANIVKLSVSAPDFKTAAKQLHYLKTATEFVKDYSVSGVVVKQEKKLGNITLGSFVTYDLVLYIKPEILLKKKI